MVRSVLQFNRSLLSMTCLLAMTCELAWTSRAQDSPAEPAETESTQVVSATQPTSTEQALETADSKVGDSKVGEPAASEPAASEPFQLPAEHHSWARFQPGAWRELQIVTETFDEAGGMTSRNIITQKEILNAVAEGKYVLNVRATVDLGTKQIVGDWKTRVLDLATDSAGTLAETRRLENRPLPLAGRESECQVWELFYVDNGRQLRDLVYYDPERFPFVLQRETADAKGQQSTPAELAQRTEVAAVEVPCQIQLKLWNCTCLRTYRHRSKGDSLRLAFINRAVPGGEVVVRATDFDAAGRRVRWSVATVLDFGDSEPPAPISTDGP
ncbi:MAG: hypothetical protein ACR2NM_13355 [Bythopirellula sp.]